MFLLIYLSIWIWLEATIATGFTPITESLVPLKIFSFEASFKLELLMPIFPLFWGGNPNFVFIRKASYFAYPLLDIWFSDTKSRAEATTRSLSYSGYRYSFYPLSAINSLFHYISGNAAISAYFSSFLITPSVLSRISYLANGYSKDSCVFSWIFVSSIPALSWVSFSKYFELDFGSCDSRIFDACLSLEEVGTLTYDDNLFG